ncbi:MAG TPA: plasmid encoded RepA protein, partial [Bryobacteraceae bacterium]|nr:plasmid encoded RepA protein [Bryobacteraceae bacterium]
MSAKHTSGNPGFQSAGLVLKQMAPELVVSKQKLRQAERSCLVRIKREEKNQTLAFNSRPFVLCGLPVLRPPQGELLFEWRNGSFVLQITGHPHFGLPFGQDRLVPIYLATLAIQQKSQTVRFKSGAEMLETFGMQKGGKEYKRLVGAFERIFGATIFFGTDTMA